MKNPTAMELWNFLIIIVPPILSASSIKADHTEVKPSESDLVPTTAQDMSARIPVIPRMEYLHNAADEIAIIVSTRRPTHDNAGKG